MRLLPNPQKQKFLQPSLVESPARSANQDNEILPFRKIGDEKDCKRESVYTIKYDEKIGKNVCAGWKNVNLKDCKRKCMANEPVKAKNGGTEDCHGTCAYVIWKDHPNPNYQPGWCLHANSTCSIVDKDPSNAPSEVWIKQDNLENCSDVSVTAADASCPDKVNGKTCILDTSITGTGVCRDSCSSQSHKLCMNECIENDLPCNDCLLRNTRIPAHVAGNLGNGLEIQGGVDFDEKAMMCGQLCHLDEKCKSWTMAHECCFLLPKCFLKDNGLLVASNKGNAVGFTSGLKSCAFPINDPTSSTKKPDSTMSTGEVTTVTVNNPITVAAVNSTSTTNTVTAVNSMSTTNTVTAVNSISTTNTVIDTVAAVNSISTTDTVIDTEISIEDVLEAKESMEKKKDGPNTVLWVVLLVIFITPCILCCTYWLWNLKERRLRSAGYARVGAYGSFSSKSKNGSKGVHPNYMYGSGGKGLIS